MALQRPAANGRLLLTSICRVASQRCSVGTLDVRLRTIAAEFLEQSEPSMFLLAALVHFSALAYNK